MLKEHEFLVLREVCLYPQCDLEAVAARTEMSLSDAKAALRRLEKDGLVDSGRVTGVGLAALEPHRVRNAVIMAAGLSSRFAPISYEKPKGLLRVRGEILVERQIEQLREAGVDDIVVVVGYKKEYFFYLEEKYGVHIVVNKEYAFRNNNSTLMAVKGLLGNTYVCSSDDYFTVNPFEPYVWKSYYAAQYQKGHTKEWCMKTGKRGRIKSVSVGGKDAWYMIGHAYFDRKFARRFVEILEQEYDRPETADKLWEQICREHLDELKMIIRKYPPGTIYEFDSLDELRQFDPLFLENIDSEVFDNIERTLGCSKRDIGDIYPLKQGITNLSCHFRTPDGEYVYRHPGVGTDLIINRKAEVEALEVARDLGIDGTYVHEDPERGWKISRFIPDSRQLDPHSKKDVKRAMRIAARLHESGATVESEFSFFSEGKGYERILLERGGIDIPGYWNLSQQAERLAACVAAERTELVLSHNDFFHLNFLVEKDGKTTHLIDWEYAGMADYANDFGTFVVCGELSEKEMLRALDFYFGRKATREEIRHNFAFVALAGWCWYVWALLKEAEGDNVGEWLYVYYRYAKKYVGRVLGWYEDEKTFVKEFDR